MRIIQLTLPPLTRCTYPMTLTTMSNNGVILNDLLRLLGLLHPVREPIPPLRPLDLLRKILLLMLQRHCGQPVRILPSDNLSSSLLIHESNIIASQMDKGDKLKQLLAKYKNQGRE